MAAIRVVSLVVLATMCVWLTGCGSSDEQASTGRTKSAHLYQAAPGDPPVIRMGWRENSTTTVVAWLVFRGQFYGFNAAQEALIDIIDGEDLPVYEDTQTNHPLVSFSRDFTYLYRGNEENGSVSATYTHPGVAVGQTYYYRARVIAPPNSSAPPISSAASDDLDVDPPTALSEASAPQGPVTYFLAPTGTRPSSMSTVDPRAVAFNWNNSTGADEYQVRVYSSSSATGQPVVQSPVVYSVGTFGAWTYSPTSTSALKGSTYYYWVVCARKGGQAEPTCGSESGWVKSAVIPFLTAPTPPSMP